MSGINFKELGWRNFQSYGNNLNVIALDFTKPTAISGKNLDATVEGQVDSNGSGKSSILNALSYVLYDQTMSDSKKDKLINWINCKNMEVYVIFEKNNIYYKIERFRKFSKKGGDGIKILQSPSNDFSEDKCKDITRDSVGRANEQIVEILGTPFDVFSRVVLLTSSTESFFSLPATSSAGKTSQTGILEELFGYTEISNKSDSLKKQKDDNKKELERLIELNSQILSEIERTKEQINFTQTQSDKWFNDTTLEINKLKNEIKIQESIDFDEELLIVGQIKKFETKIQENLALLKEKETLIENSKRAKAAYDNWELKKLSDIKKIQDTINALSSIDFNEQLEIYKFMEELVNNRTILMKAIDEQLKSKNTLEADIKRQDAELSHLNNKKCPYCLQDFKDVQDKINELTSNIEIAKTSIASILPSMFENEAHIKSIADAILTKRTQLLFSSKEEAIAKRAEFESLSFKLSDKTNECNPYSLSDDIVDISDIDKLKSNIAAIKVKIDKFKSVQKFAQEKDLYHAQSSLASNKKLLENIEQKKNPHTATLEKLTNLALPETKNEKIEELKDTLEHEEFLYKLLTKKDSYIRKALLNKNLPFLNGRLKHHLNQTGLPHKVVITENMSAAISQFGTAIEYSSLSTGQRARIDLAASFAFRDVLQTRHEKINLCMLDEYLDASGLSQAGTAMAIKLIKSIAREEKIPIFIISHRDEITSQFDSKIEVELNNKFSNIIRADIRYSSSE